MVPRARIARRVYTDLACRWPHDRVAPMLTAITLGAFAQAPPSKTQHVKVSVVPARPDDVDSPEAIVRASFDECLHGDFPCR
jgi:hypothetical protein